MIDWDKEMDEKDWRLAKIKRILTTEQLRRLTGVLVKTSPLGVEFLIDKLEHETPVQKYKNFLKVCSDNFLELEAEFPLIRYERIQCADENNIEWRFTKKDGRTLCASNGDYIAWEHDGTMSVVREEDYEKAKNEHILVKDESTR